jgi:predicted metal-dependent hydrolase
MPFIQYDHKPLLYTLRRSKRAKRLHIIARSHSFEVVAPWRITNQAIIQFLCQQRRWMSKQQNRQVKKSEATSLWPCEFLGGHTVPYRGMQLLLVVRYGLAVPPILEGDRLLVSIPFQTPCVEVEKAIKAQLLHWYQKQAMSIIEASIQVFCQKLGKWPKVVKLKQQKSRWGSCGITQNIYLNWLLVIAPAPILEYVVAHELGHLFYRNHGPRFWGKVAECMSDFKTHDRWLNRHGQQLKLPSHWST